MMMMMMMLMVMVMGDDDDAYPPGVGIHNSDDGWFGHRGHGHWGSTLDATADDDDDDDYDDGDDDDDDEDDYCKFGHQVT